ncbi:MAG: DUF4384 domain-containing protein [Candidatus Zixiibacteriota bacterium]
MLRSITKLLGMTALLAVILAPVVRAQQDEVFSAEDYDQIKIDRYLDVEIWTNHSDDEFYDGDNLVLNFRANRDAFVAIYSIDSRGRVNMLFPVAPEADNFIRGGATYSLPGGDDDFDFVVSGPSGVENIQIIASRERFPLPDWYPSSGLVCDWDDRLDYMDYLNSHYFVRYGGQRFAFDRAAIYINEWEPEYYRPIHYPHYPTWTVCGNVYIDYPWGGTVYIDGVYWGVAPLYIPRIYIGWHTFTVYDYYGYCWEYPVHITRYHTVVLDRTIVNPLPTVVSKYKDVRVIGYRDPITSGYPTFKTKSVVGTPSKTVITGSKTVSKVSTDQVSLDKKYVRGAAKVVKTDRGFETVGNVTKSGAAAKSKDAGESARSYQSGKSRGSDASGDARKSTVSERTSRSTGSEKATRSSGSQRVTKGSSSSKTSSEAGSGYYQKKSGSSSSSRGAAKTVTKGSSDRGSSSSGSRPTKVEKQSSGSGSSKATAPAKSNSSSDNSSSKSKSTDNKPDNSTKKSKK